MIWSLIDKKCKSILGLLKRDKNKEFICKSFLALVPDTDIGPLQEINHHMGMCAWGSG